MVTKSGLPIGYKAFSGDTFDGHTILYALQDIQEHYKIDNVVFVADSGMFNKNNLDEFDKVYYSSSHFSNSPNSNILKAKTNSFFLIS